MTDSALLIVMKGWTKFYEFSMSDLRAGADIIDRLCKRAGRNDVPWNFVHGLYEQAIYGGRVDSPFDIQVRMGPDTSTLLPHQM